MGNWMTVQIIGTCDKDDVPALKEALTYSRDTFEGFHCLVCGGVCGLPNWAAQRISVTGNLAERGYTTEDIRQQLEKLAEVAPSLEVVVHCGGDYESLKCVASVALKAGKAVIEQPQIEELDDIPEDQMMGNLFGQLYGFR